MAEQSISKRCRSCKQTKRIYEFYKSSRNQDGYRNQCKVCHLKRGKKYRQSIQGKAAEKRYKQSPKGKKTQSRACLKWYYEKEGQAHRKAYEQSVEGKAIRQVALNNYRKRHPEKVEARKAVKYAIRAGKLPRPDTLQCHYCPKQAKDYHHHKGYEPKFWLDVIPVCIPCHTKTRYRK